MASFVLHVHVFFLLHLFLGFCSGDFQYECIPEAGSTIQIKIDKTVSGLAGFNLTVDSPNSCKQDKNSSFFILTSCPHDQSIQIEFTKADTHSIVKKAGVRMFTLRCQNDNKPVTKMIKATLAPVNDGTQAPVLAKNFSRTDWVPDLTMTVSQNAKIVIGTNVTVTISTADPQYKFTALECSASSGNTPYYLWKEDCSSVDNNLFGAEAWKRSSDNLKITHRLEAFRFADSHTLDLTCKVKICPAGKDDECTLGCKKTSIRRRRRDVNSKTTVVKTTLNVVDSLQDFSNSGSGPFLATSLVSTAAIMYSMVL